MSTTPNFSDVRDQYADFFGRACAVYNINPLLGRLYGSLLLSLEPMNLDDLSQISGVAKSTVSVAMRNLENYRVVRRHWLKGDRRDYFTARTDTRTILQELYDQFFSRELKYMTDANSSARLALESHSSGEDWPTDDQREDLLGRVREIEDMLKLATGYLNELLGKEGLPVKPAQAIAIEVDEE